MTVSKTPVTKPDLPSEDGKGQMPAETQQELGLTRENKSNVDAGHAVPPTGGEAGALNLLVWLIISCAVGVAWYYHAHWVPIVAPYIGMGAKAPDKPRNRIVPVVTAAVQKKDMDVFINGLGTVTAFKTVTVRSRVEGELVKVHFTEGQMVKEGDLIAEIDRRQYDVQLQQALGALERDQATLKSAEFTLKRYQELIGSKSITPQQMDEQRALVQQTSGALQSDEANIANAKLQLDFCHIVAPISGRIGLRLVDQGNIIRANDPTGLAVITQLQPIALVFTIPQDDISRVQKAFSDNPELQVTAWDRDFKTKLANGKLLAIDNQVDSTTGTVRLKAEFNNEDNLLFPNQFVNVRLLVDVRRDAIVVPNAAVQRGPTATFVYVVQKEPKSEGSEEMVEKVELRNVTLGISEGAETAILTGLTPGEIVVTDGLDKLKKGDTVTTEAKEKKEGGKEGSKEKEKEKDKRPGEAGAKPADQKKAEAPAGNSKKKSQ